MGCRLRVGPAEDGLMMVVWGECVCGVGSKWLGGRSWGRVLGVGDWWGRPFVRRLFRLSPTGWPIAAVLRGVSVVSVCTLVVLSMLRFRMITDMG